MTRVHVFGLALVSLGLAPATKLRAGEIARVNDQVIMTEDVDRAFRRTSVSQRTLTEDQLRLYRAHVLRLLVDEALVNQFLDREKILVPEQEVDDHVEQFRAKMAERGDSLDEFLARMGIDEERMRTDIRNLRRWLTHVEKSATPDAVAKYFEANQAAFDGSEVRASHILVKTDPGMDDAARKAARKRIEGARAQLVGGTPFEQAAKTHSDCPSRDIGGDLDFFPRKGVMAEPFAAAAFALAEGEVSDVVETEFGYHLIKVTGRRPGGAVLYAEVYDVVRAAFAEDLRATVIAEMKKTADIRYTR